MAQDFKYWMDRAVAAWTHPNANSREVAAFAQLAQAAALDRIGDLLAQQTEMQKSRFLAEMGQTPEQYKAANWSEEGGYGKDQS